MIKESKKVEIVPGRQAQSFFEMYTICMNLSIEYLLLNSIFKILHDNFCASAFSFVSVVLVLVLGQWYSTRQ